MWEDHLHNSFSLIDQVLGNKYQGKLLEIIDERTHGIDAAFLVKEHFMAYVEERYGLMRDNLKKELGMFLFLCIQMVEEEKLRMVKKTRLAVEACDQELKDKAREVAALEMDR
ncbi:hypothetical protein POM88_011300 [Heracleum sosnowskyi]|uniref:Uncharacterized protein n=1 Tax=Heracleum sosnowskyi TaxID=360622 RepID=A0AAD8IU85_9APIA|nr:hypothetical protein POM88_011300 [Heracleum sosnowskyi]